LLHAAFRPDAEIAALRTLVRYRAELIAHRAPHILHLQKALQQMNIQLERVLSDIMGTTGQATSVRSWPESVTLSERRSCATRPANRVRK
jgi:hypothetical protein